MNKFTSRLISFFFVLVFALPSSKAIDTLEIALPTTFQAKCGQNTPIPITVKNFASLKSLSFSLSFNGNLLQFVSVGMNNAITPTANSQGNNIATFSWASNTAKTFADGSTIFEIVMKPNNGGGQTTPLEFKMLPTNILALNSSNQQVPVKVKNGNLQIVDDIPPVPTCPPSAVYYVPMKPDTIISSLSGMVLDNCGAGSISNFTLSGATMSSGVGDASQMAFKQGITNAIYTAKDGAGNTAQCDFKVVVKNNKNLTLFATAPIVNCNDSIVKVDVFAVNAFQMSAFQFFSIWDTTLYSYRRFENVNPALGYLPAPAIGNTGFNITDVSNGRLELAAPLSANDITIPDNVRLFTVVLKVKGKPGKSIFKFEETDFRVNGVSVPSDLLATPLDVEDKISPTITCPPDVTVRSTAAGATSVQVNNLAVVATDNCGLKSVTYVATGATAFSGNNDASGKLFAPGVTTVRYDAQDFGNNVTPCAFKVDVNRVAISLKNDTISCNSNTYTMNIRVSDFNNIGKTTFTLNFPPTKLGYQSHTLASSISGLTNVDVSNAILGGKITIDMNSFSGVSLPDNAIFITLVFNVLDQTITNNYPLTITNKNAEYRNPTETTFLESNDASVLILDVEPPKITNCPQDLTVTTSTCTATVGWANPIILDNCDATPTIVINKAPNSTFDAGETTVTYKVTDKYNNTSYCTFEVFVKDNQPPVFGTCPTDTTELVVNANCFASLPLIPENATDNCNSIIILQDPPQGTQLTVGVYKVVLTAEDISKNQTTCNQYVKVVDKTAPQFLTFPNPQLIPSEVGTCGAKVTYVKPTVKDNCDAAPEILASALSGDFFSVKTDSIQFVVLDKYGNNTKRFLKYKIYDAEPPKFVDCPNGIIKKELFATATCEATFALPILKATDNCRGNFDVAPINPPVNNIFPKGKTIIEYIAKDLDLPNQVLCKYEVTVKDTTRPSIVCPKNDTISTNNNNCIATKALPTPVIADNCSPIANLSLSNDYNLNIFNIGTRKITYTVTDEVGNKNTCAFSVTVSDKVKPIITNMPSQINADSDADKCGKNVTFISPTPTDNCQIASFTSNKKSGDFFPVGFTFVVFTAIDNSGNVAKDSFLVYVNDKIAPTFATPFSGGAITVYVEPTKCVGKFKFPQVIDNCSAANQISLSINNLNITTDEYAVGTYPLNFLAKDALGNILTSSVVLTVIDTIKPKVVNCPADVTQNAGAGCDYTFANNLPMPTFTDNCDGMIPNSSITIVGIPANLKFPLGTTKVNYTAKDKKGNTAVCEYNVNIKGSAAPVFLQPCKDITVDASATKCDTSLIIPNPPLVVYNCSGKDKESFTDVSNNQQFTTDKPYTFKVGTTSLNYIATNLNGLSTTCNMKVTVLDKTKPSFTSFPADQTKSLSLANNCKEVISWQTPKMTDACDTTGLKLSIISPIGVKPGDEFPVGKTEIVYQVTDKQGNTNTKSFTITVEDKIAPTFTNCPKQPIKLGLDGTKTDPENVILNFSNTQNCDSVTIIYKPLIATDNCTANVSYEISPTILPGKNFKIGKNTITWTAYDNDKKQNPTTCAFEIEILPLTAAKASISANLACIGETVQLDAATVANATYTWKGPNNFSQNIKNPKVTINNKNADGKYVVNYKIGNCNSSFDTVKLNILGAPTATDDVFTIENSKLLNGNVILNDTLIKGETYKISLAQNINNPNAGTFKLNPDGTFTFVSNSLFTGELVFKYNVCYDDCPDACAKEKQVKIIVTAASGNNFTLPTLFTPNDDGVNDLFVINGLAGKTGAKLSIFSQWGEPVFESVDYKNDWNGKWNSKDLPDGTYYYIFEYNSAVQKGFINIFR